jgi:DNA-directed RNA polymerase subunit RPC12/RpoP
MRYGRLDPRCAACKTPFDPAEVTSGAEEVACPKCSRRAAARKAPQWLRSTHPDAAWLVNEDTGGERVHATASDVIEFHCYHCGAPMPLDGKARRIPCTYCKKQVVVPDDVWRRLHPVRTIEGWFIVFDREPASASASASASTSGSSAAPLPEDADEFCDLAPTPDGGFVVAWHDRDEGDVGHPARLALVRRDGSVAWRQDGVEFSDDAILCPSPSDGAIWVVDPELGFARAIDPKSGDPVRTLASPLDDAEDRLNVRGSSEIRGTSLLGIWIDWDGTFVVWRKWTDTEHARLRRFARDGKRMPLWGKHEPNEEYVEWPELRDHPAMFRYDSCVGLGWDGHYWIAENSESKYFGRYTLDGRFLGAKPLPAGVMARVHAIGAARDGTGFVLFHHTQKLDDQAWACLLRIDPNGEHSIVAGALAREGRPLLGLGDDHMTVHPDGTVYVGSDLDSLRVFDRDGNLVWMSASTRVSETGLRERIERARGKGKRLVKDRES